ncbi:WbqC family protein [Castellaniella ginsengisoli]|uniref:WbqC family protein n=1 Tax=Castellaniella ginsengisoli TaxID=546114 RepID=A0AB39D8L7_9BURK
MKIGIMQPYFLPYIGYFQLINCVDEFVLYDNIKYTKKGWINRNRILLNGEDVVFSIPLKKDSDSLDVCDRWVSPDFMREKLLNKFYESYRKAPEFGNFFPVIESIVRFKDDNLFNYIRNSVQRVCEYFEIGTNIIISSHVCADHTLRGVDRVLSICKSEGARSYINPIGGLDLYSRDGFSKQGVDLFFLKSRPSSYPQYGGGFVPWLSIVDVAMFNPHEVVARHMLNDYDLI